jgi:glucosyl-3-phosphoglycerate synthase
MGRTFHFGEFDARRLLAAKGQQAISICLPAKDEGSTVGMIVRRIRTELMERVPLVDEVLVVDDCSLDATAKVAEDAGARVVSTEELLPELGPGTGKGEALWKSVFASEGDLIVWCDADVTNFGIRFVVGLLGPLLLRSEIGFVKGYYDRPMDNAPGTGGRVTELVARPLISLLFPRLAPIVQPLSGEYAGRRTVLEAVPFVQGYGVDLGLLIDVTARFGMESVAQVDLGTRVHRNRTLDELSPMALAIMQTAFTKAHLPLLPSAQLVRPGLEPLAVPHVERPALAQLDSYLRRLA